MAEKGVDVAGVVVQDRDGKFLCVQECKEVVRGQWNMPAGHVDPGETAQQAAIREAREETGYIVELVSESPLLEEYDPLNERWFRVFRAKVVGGDLRIDPTQVQDVRWLTFEEMTHIYNAGQFRAEWIYKAFHLVHAAEPQIEKGK